MGKKTNFEKQIPPSEMFNQTVAYSWWGSAYVGDPTRNERN